MKNHRIKKRLIITVKLLCSLLMLLTSLMTLNLEGVKMTFSGFSDISFIDLTIGSIVWQLIFVLLFVLVAFIKFVDFQKLRLLTLIMIVFFWILSGRTIGYMEYPDGRVMTGWFGIKTNEFGLCSEDMNCETELYNNTIVRKLPMWRLKISNSYIDKNVFLGPFIWQRGIKLISKSKE